MTCNTLLSVALLFVAGCVYDASSQPELKLCRDAHAKYSQCGISFDAEPACDDVEYCRSQCAADAPGCESIALGMLGAPTAYGQCASGCMPTTP